jgi:hypothetical protein
MEVSGQLHAPAASFSGETAPGSHWMGPSVSLGDMEETLLGLELRPFCRPAHSQLLYQLHYLSCLGE